MAQHVEFGAKFPVTNVAFELFPFLVHFHMADDVVLVAERHVAHLTLEFAFTLKEMERIIKKLNLVPS